MTHKYVGSANSVTVNVGVRQYIKLYFLPVCTSLQSAPQVVTPSHYIVLESSWQMEMEENILEPTE